MNQQNADINIRQYQKKGFAAVIELDDEVEYIMTDKAIDEIASLNEVVTLIRVIDRKPIYISARRILWAIKEEGIIDYIESKNV